MKADVGKLLYESKFKRFTGQQVNKCLELLVQTSLQDGVGEKEALFSENMYYFQRLRDVTLIQKQKTRVDGQKDFRWVIHKRMQEAIRAVEAKYHRGVSDYLLKVYAGESYKARAAETYPSSVSQERKPLSRILSCDLSRAVKDSISEAQRLFDSAQITDPSGEQRRQIIDRMRTGLNSLLTAFFNIDESAVMFSRVQIHNPDARIALHWMSDDVVNEAYQRICAFEIDPSRLNFEYAHKRSNDAYISIAEQLENVVLDIADPTRPVPFRHRAIRHTDSELSIFHNIERNYFSADGEKHFGYIEQITNHLEEKFRAFLYLTTNAVFGEAKYFDHVNKNDKKYAHKNMDSRSSYSSVGNLFEGFTRPQFRPAFMEGEIRKVITSALALAWTPAEWTMFFNLFIEENIATSHKQRGSYSPVERDRYARYCKLSEELTAQINFLTSQLVDRYSFVVVAETVQDVARCRRLYVQIFISHQTGRRDSSNANCIYDEHAVYLRRPGWRTLAAIRIVQKS